MNNFTKMTEVFGFQVPTDTYYLHRGHAWAVVEKEGLVRVGLDDFSQRLLGAADEVRLPEIGKSYYQDHLCLALFRQGRKASFEAPGTELSRRSIPRSVKIPAWCTLIPTGKVGCSWLNPLISSAIWTISSQARPTSPGSMKNPTGC
jgi:hypothetical protein